MSQVNFSRFHVLLCLQSVLCRREYHFGKCARLVLFLDIYVIFLFREKRGPSWPPSRSSVHSSQCFCIPMFQLAESLGMAHLETECLQQVIVLSSFLDFWDWVSL